MTRPNSATLPAIPDWALLLALSLGAAQAAFAQHQFDAEAWIEMRKMFREKGPTPTIEEDVAALAGGGARRAGPRLIDRGPEVLPAVHSALLAPGVSMDKAVEYVERAFSFDPADGRVLHRLGFIHSMPRRGCWRRLEPRAPPTWKRHGRR